MKNDEIEITVAGCGDAFSSGGNLHTCFHVKTQNIQFLIDCGSSALAGLKRYGIDTKSLNAIVISHFHGDHFGGIPFIILQLFKVEKRTFPLTIISPVGGKEKINALFSLLYAGAEDVLENEFLHYIEYNNYEEIKFQSIKITAYPVLHAVLSQPHGLRFEINGKTLAYSGDTEWTDELISLSDKADLFICECNNYKNISPGHMNISDIKKNYLKLNCSNLVLTHFGDEMLKNKESLNYVYAIDGMKFTL